MLCNVQEIKGGNFQESKIPRYTTITRAQPQILARSLPPKHDATSRRIVQWHVIKFKIIMERINDQLKQ